MFHLVLYQPEIPPNTGNIIRLAAATGAKLHLIKPLGFALDDKALRRAGLDYHEFANTIIHQNWSDFYGQHLSLVGSENIYAMTTKGSVFHTSRQFSDKATFLFGCETRGLPAEILQLFSPRQRLRLPMLAERRSLNLANAAAITIYEAWRQQDFTNAI